MVAELPDICRVMVTGHRKIGGSYQDTDTHHWVRASLRQLLSRLQVKYGDNLTAISGMAIGVDMIFAEEALSLGIPFVAAVPFSGQESQWPPASQSRYRNILAQATKIILVDELPQYNAASIPAKLQLRNLWMIDHSNMTIAVWDGGVGGTANTVKACRKIGRKVLRVDPVKREIGVEKAA